MSKLPSVSSTPKIAVQYILDTAKLRNVPGLDAFFKKVKKTIRNMGWDLKEFGPHSDPDIISENARSCAGQHAAFIGITFTGTSARQTAVIGRFNGPVAVWYFPGNPWWSMASASSGLGYLHDEAQDNPNIKVAPIAGDPADPATIESLNTFAAAAHTVFAMKREKIGLVGGAYYDVMPASNWHPDTLTNRLGPSYTEIDMSMLVRETKNTTDAEADALLRTLKKTGMTIASDANSQKTLRMSAKASIGIEKLQQKWGLTGAAINCYGGPDPEAYTGVLGYCGASGCLKGHALNSIVIGCESDVVQCAQQMLFRHLLGVVPCMADPWKLGADGVLIAGTCSGPACLAKSPSKVSLEAGTLMSLYKVGVLGVCFPQIEKTGAIVARIGGRRLDKMVVSTGEFIKSDSVTMPGRLALHVKLDDPNAFLTRGAIGNHYTFFPTGNIARDLARLEMLCGFLNIKIERC